MQIPRTPDFMQVGPIQVSSSFPHYRQGIDKKFRVKGFVKTMSRENS